MVVECVKTCVIHASEMVASYEKARVITLPRECIDFDGLSAIQFCPRGLIRVTFKDAADKEDFVHVGLLTLDGHDLSVTSSDKPHSLVYIHYFPVEGDDALIRDELGKYGEVISVKHQSFSGIPGLLTGSRVLTMVLSDPVLAEFRIDDYPVRVWYKGIPPFCQICKISGHKAADCQFNGKCRRCGSPDHKAHVCTRPWGQPAVPMEVAVPEVVPDPSETVVPAVSDSSAVLDEGADETVEDVVEDDEVADVEVVAVVEGDAVADVVEVADKEVVAVLEDVVVEDVDVVQVDPVSTPAGVPVLNPDDVEVLASSDPVASCRIFTPELRRKFFLGYRDMLCQYSGNAAYVILYRNSRVCVVFPVEDSDEVRLTFDDKSSSFVSANLVRISKAYTSNEMSEIQYARFILNVRQDPSYRISFRGSIVDSIGPTEHNNVLIAAFTDHTGPQIRKLPAKALSVKNIALNSNSSGANVNSSVNNVNNVNKASSSSTVDDGIVHVSRNSSRSLVPTAVVLAAELLKRTTPPSVVGVPKCRKKL